MVRDDTGAQNVGLLDCLLASVWPYTAKPSTKLHSLKPRPQDSMLLDEDFTTVDADLIFARVKSRPGKVSRSRSVGGFRFSGLIGLIGLIGFRAYGVLGFRL